MKNLVMIFLALLLLLATVEADGQMFKRLDPKLLSDQQATTSSQLGRKADVGVRYDNNPTFGHYGRDNGSNDANHHIYINGNNPYAPRLKKSP
ncbi:hypothetical protein CRYUN_Cryun36dG0104500 [Craigia yunnanensis]